MRKGLTIIMCLAVFAVLVCDVQAQEAKRVKITGKQQTMPIGNLSDLAAVTIIDRADGEPFDVAIHENATGDLVSGYNHDMDGEQLDSGHVPGLSTDTSSGAISIDADLTLEGSPVDELYDIDRINVAAMVNAYKTHADVTVTGLTGLQKWGTGDSIGGPDDYKIIYLHNTKLQLEDDFTGYGILIIEDDHSGAGMAELHLQGNAKWYGMVICCAVDTPGLSDKIYISVGKPGEGAWLDKPSWLKKALAFLGLEPGLAYAKKPGAEDRPQILGSILMETRSLDLRLDDGDILFCSEAIAGCDGITADMATGFEWEEWQEIE